MKNKALKLLPVIMLFSCLFSCAGEELNTSSTSSNLNPEIYKVFGKVITTTDVAVKNVTLKVSLKGTYITETTTDENGYYEIWQLETGSYEMMIVPPSDSYVYDGDKVRFSYLQEPDFKMRDITLRKTNFQWGELS